MCRRGTFDLDFAQQALDLVGLDQPGAQMLRGFGATGDREGQRLLHRAALVAGGDEAREERVARADGGPRLDRAPAHAHAQDLRVDAVGRQHAGEAAVGHGHDRLVGAELAHLPDRVCAVLVVVELVPDELLGLEHVRGDHVRLGAHGAAQRVAVGVDHGGDVQAPQLADQEGVDVVVDVARQRAREHAHARALGQVEELVDEELDLVRRDLRALLVDLGLLARGGIDHRGVRARLLADPHEVAEHRELRELVDDAGAGRAAREARGDHGRAERLEHPRDVDALAARHRRLLDGAMAPSEPEVRHGERLVDGRVERDGDDHAARASRLGRRPVEARRSNRTVATMSTAMPPITYGRPAQDLVRWVIPAAGTADSATRATVATLRPPWETSTRPRRCPERIGPSTVAGAWTESLTSSRWPRWTIRRIVRSGTRLSVAPWRKRIWAVASLRPSITGRMRWKRGNAHLRRFTVSMSRAASDGVSRTALMSWMPSREPLPTST